MDALIDALLDWIGAQTDYDIAQLPRPAVIELSPEELTLEYYSGAPQLLPADGVDDRLNALFNFVDGAHGTIYLLEADEIDGADYFDDPTENPLFREILLHELVHFVQWQTGAAETWDCPSYGEREAYLLGGAYLRASRTTDPMPNRMFWAHAYARC